MRTFMDRAVAGEIHFKELENELEKEIELWHTGDSKIPLVDFLGMTRREYALWVQQAPAPSLTLDVIVNARKAKLKK